MTNIFKHIKIVHLIKNVLVLVKMDSLYIIWMSSDNVTVFWDPNFQ